MTGPITWVKAKYTRPKDKGRYKGGTNAPAKKSDRKRKKVGGGPGPVEHVMVIGTNGKVHWETRPRENVRK